MHSSRVAAFQPPYDHRSAASRLSAKTTYRIVDCRWETGEHYPMLVDAQTGHPPWWPTLFITTQIRPERSSATMESTLRAIKLLLAYVEAHGIDLQQRVLSRQYLAFHELDALCDSARRRFDGTGHPGPADGAAPVSKAHYYNRLECIATYLKWFADTLLGIRRAPDDDKALDQIVKAIRGRKPRWARGASLRDRALTDEQCDRLLEVIRPDHPNNPFTDPRTAERNELAVEMLLRLGIRRGELLALKVPGINWQTRSVSINRMADDPEDPRTSQPKAKTLARDLPLSPELTDWIHQYIRGARRQTKGANRHLFLFVVHRKGPHEGEPLSEPGLTKAFATLRRCDPLLSGLHPHALRHTWNWKFSGAVDALPPAKRPTEAKEEQVRSHLMGWEPGSGTARVYNERHIAEKAHEATKLIHERLQSHRAQATSNG